MHTPLGYAAAAAAILRLAVRLFAHGLTNTVALVLR